MRWLWRLLLVVSLMEGGCHSSPDSNDDRDTTMSDPRNDDQSSDLTRLDMKKLRPRVEAFCGDCHAMPAPSTFPRAAWHAEVQQGYDFYYASARTDLKPPPMHDVVAYYRALAPERLEQPVIETASESPISFTSQSIVAPNQQDAICVSGLAWEPARPDTPASLWLCDMGSGVVARVEFDGRNPKVTNVAKVQNPASVTLTDFDRDGSQDLLIADLGSFNPEDHQNGRVHWLRQPFQQNSQPVLLGNEFARVADVQTADFDQDGDEDVLVAEFGWRKTGRILLLKNEGFENRLPRLTQQVLDPRHGTIHVEIADLDDDGDLDFVALISQEHEVVEAFLNRGDGTFETHRIFEANDPSYGSSGIELVDLDHDADLDLLYTNGDTLDSFYLKPTHAIHWLENTGNLQFEDHILTHVPGVYRAVSQDLDGDNDLDIVAVTNWPNNLIDRDRQAVSDRVLWLEQTSPGKFLRHTISTDKNTGHYTVAVGDFDADGKPDLAVGNAAVNPKTSPEWISIWWNEG